MPAEHREQGSGAGAGTVGDHAAGRQAFSTWWSTIAQQQVNVVQAVSSLTATLARSVLALVGIAVGIAAVIAMVTTGEIVKEESLKQFRALGIDVLTVTQRHAPPNEGLTRLHIASLPTNVPQVARATGWTNQFGPLMYRGKLLQRIQVRGVSEAYAELHKSTIAEGRFISEFDRGRPFCVLGNRLAARMRDAGATDVVGEEVRFGDRLFTVVGVLGPHPGSLQSPGTDQVMFIPIAVSQRMGREVENAIARVRTEADANVGAEQVAAYLARGLPDARLEVVSARELIAQMQRQATTFTLLFAAVGSISLIVGGVGVMNVMLMSVAERRAEIGLRRAVGARRADVIGQFLMESALLCLVGGSAGILVGLLAAWGISLYSGWSFFVPPVAVVLGVGVSTAVGVFFGLYPAGQAARLDPIVALRAA